MFNALNMSFIEQNNILSLPLELLFMNDKHYKKSILTSIFVRRWRKWDLKHD